MDLVLKCNVCRSLLGEPIYDSGSSVSLTSLCEIIPGSSKVYDCQSCSHIQSAEIANVSDYYDKQYTILVNSEEEDQIYEVVEGNLVYRSEHQLKLLINKLGLHSKPKTKILDYGCAKGALIRQLSSLQLNLSLHLFDVSDRYIQFWERFLNADQWATYEIPEKWHCYFDVVTSFFALEHIVDLDDTLRQIKKCLSPDGVFYFVVPNTYTNPADFIVVDHVNHFTSNSLLRMLLDAGFDSVEIDEKSHRGAFVVVARKGIEGTARQQAKNVEQTLKSTRDISAYWKHCADSIQSFENSHQGKKSAIYGAGFYGCYILSQLQKTEFVSCFLDQSPFQQNETIYDKPVLSPSQLSENVEVIYVGLNPSVARNGIGDIVTLRERQIDYFYL